MGGLDIQQQAKELARRPHVVIATPGRLKVRPATEHRAAKLARHRLSCHRSNLLQD